MNREQAQHLLDVADVMRSLNSKKITLECTFDMRYEFLCGTPSCCLGHYSVSEYESPFSIGDVDILDSLPVPVHGDESQHWFGITRHEAIHLFGARGCNSAQTPVEAAEYIENFLDQKGWFIEE